MAIAKLYFVRHVKLERSIALLTIVCLVAGCGQRPSSPATTPNDPESDAWQKRFAAFKQRNLPKVGTVITVRGVLQRDDKSGMFVPFDEGEVFIRPTAEADISKDNEIANRFLGRPVTVTGTLQYFPPATPLPSTERPVSVPIEHFFFDVARVTITEEAQR